MLLYVTTNSYCINLQTLPPTPHPTNLKQPTQPLPALPWPSYPSPPLHPSSSPNDQDLYHTWKKWSHITIPKRRTSTLERFATIDVKRKRLKKSALLFEHRQTNLTTRSITISKYLNIIIKLPPNWKEPTSTNQKPAPKRIDYHQ